MKSKDDGENTNKPNDNNKSKFVTVRARDLVAREKPRNIMKDGIYCILDLSWKAFVERRNQRASERRGSNIIPEEEA